MKIIDAHLHLFPAGEDWAQDAARRAGHQNSVEHLRQVYPQWNMVHGVVMGNRSLDPDYHSYPADLFHYCAGLDRSLLKSAEAEELSYWVEENLKRESCCGVKLYPGYNRIWLTDPMFDPIYRLAARYDKPVAVHMGATAHPRAHLKYAHPLVLDEVAVDYKDTRFVMCHFGNPFLESAAAVLEKNPNVSTDLSGLLVGRVEVEQHVRQYGAYISALKGWLAYTGRWSDIMYATDWPIVNLGEYVRFVEHLVPEEHREKVFFENANRIYGLGL